MFSELHKGFPRTKRAESRGVKVYLVHRICLRANICTIPQALHAATEKALRLANMELQQVESRTAMSYDVAPFSNKC